MTEAIQVLATATSRTEDLTALIRAETEATDALAAEIEAEIERIRRAGEARS